MMLEAVVAGAVAEREEEVVTLVVAGAEEGGILGGDALVSFQTFGTDGRGPLRCRRRRRSRAAALRRA